jgi:hypothetical protein
MITYSWNCESVEVFPENEGNENVVYAIHWSLNAFDSENDLSAKVFGVEIIDYLNHSNFIDFEDLDNETVISWLSESMTPDKMYAIELNAANQILEKQTPSSILMKLTK